ncbi:hypothetical protein QAD02_002615 [Eretmocerus hayati]|uniref:Uncharacterized protein n=1 Tax=Eretmocerus hayati TaxID=131215 RepID=A0ACC2NKE3_9HYME|nr:hypothetical protein QAD02_002615 [Eretmocerus hayati]
MLSEASHERDSDQNISIGEDEKEIPEEEQVIMEVHESRRKKADRQRMYRSVLREFGRQISDVNNGHDEDPSSDILDDFVECDAQNEECFNDTESQVMLQHDPIAQRADDFLDQEMLSEASHGRDSDQNLSVDEDEREIPEEEQLRTWAVHNNLTDSSIDQLLQILRSRLMPELPKTSKTFFRTDIRHKVHQVIDDNQELSEYVYYGIEENLRRVINPLLHLNKTIELLINLDGLSVYKSTNIQFWPILIKVHVDEDLYKPFVAGAWSGRGKPDMENPLWRIFIHDLNGICRAGLNIDGEIYDVILKGIIADCPARATMKCTKGHGGYSACERCVVEGERVKNSIVYLDCNAEARTDESFRNRTDQEHHHSPLSPFLDIEGLDMITMFILDYMHLGCNGVTYKLLCDYWIYGKRKTKFTRSELKELSRRLACIRNKCIPIEFQRKSRDCESIKRWKATELRFFLLYSGPIILRGLLKNNFYNHFILLHVSFRILCSDYFKTKNDTAKVYLEKFVQAAPLLYGRRFMSINAHNLLHIVDDTINMGCNLSKLSAFPFENCLKKLRDLVHASNKPLAQLNRRLQQIPNPILETPRLTKKVIILKKKTLQTVDSIKKMKFKNSFTLTCTRPNNCVMDKYGRIILIKKMYSPVNDKKNIRISGKILKKVRVAYNYPERSSAYGIYEVSKRNDEIEIVVDLLEQKMILLSLNFKFDRNYKHFVVPLLH